MHAKPGGKQPATRDTEWNGKKYTMVFAIGLPKGLIQLSLNWEERYRPGMKLEEMCAELASHLDFREEKTKLEHFLNKLGHVCIFLPKFHCELNPIKRCWAQAKRYPHAHTNYTIQKLRTKCSGSISFDSVTVENITNYFRKVRHYNVCLYIYKALLVDQT